MSPSTKIRRMAEEKSRHLVLLGDSIFDNGAYTGAEPDVITHLRSILPGGWTATLCAVMAASPRTSRRSSRGCPGRRRIWWFRSVATMPCSMRTCWRPNAVDDGGIGAVRRAHPGLRDELSAGDRGGARSRQADRGLHHLQRQPSGAAAGAGGPGRPHDVQRRDLRIACEHRLAVSS